VSAGDLDTWVWDQVVRALEYPSLVLEEARKTEAARVGERDELTMRLNHLNKVLADLPRERERTQTIYREGYATLEELKTQLVEIDRKRDSLSEERARILTRLGSQTLDEMQASRLGQIVSWVRGRLDRLTRQEQFDAIHAVVERIVVHLERRIEISACVPLGAQSAEAYVRTQWDDGLVVASMSSSRPYRRASRQQTSA